MIINRIVPLLLFTGFLFGQDNIETTATKYLSQSEVQKEVIEIETKDGNIFLGTLLDETEDNYKIKTNDGIEINMPKSSVKNFNAIATAEFGDEV